MKGDTKGWWDVTAHALWKCPECGEVSDPETWEETRPGCGECGDHDGRKCPRCGEVFDHVWTCIYIEAATLEMELFTQNSDNS